MQGALTRRRFLQGAGAFACALSLGQLRTSPASGSEGSGTSAAAARDYRGWEDLYRQQWSWDRVAKGTHHVNCWYQRGCNWNVFVKNGVVWREEQAGTYPQTNPEVPDYNPRGCQKGACYSERMYDSSRLRHPLKRAGKRGEGRWKRISWEQALREVADRTIDVLREDGPGAIVWDPGTAATGGCHGMGTYRAAFLLDTPVMELNAEAGDHHPGAMATVGKISYASSADDLFYSDLILIWGGNPVCTQIPNAHFINEARYNGARIVTIAPDFSPSSVHADAWIPVRVGTDAALGLGMAHVMIEEKIHDARFIQEQTDMPLLVREDTGKLLRGNDLEAGGPEDVFYVFDRSSGAIRESDRRTLELGDVDPALEGSYRATTVDGEVPVTPVFERFRRHLRAYSPEAVQKITGTHADVIRDLAREIAHARAATFLTQSNFSKFYHGLEMERAQILVLTLAGQIGKKGSGITGFPAMVIAGTEAINIAGGGSGSSGESQVAEQIKRAFAEGRAQGLTDEMMIFDRARQEYQKGNLISGSIYFNEKGLGELYGSSHRWDPHMKRPLREYYEEAVSKRWQVPPARQKPRIFFEIGGNVLRRTRGYNRLHETWLPELELVLSFDWRMSHTALHSDYVLPAAAWYEKDDITYATPIAPFSHPTTRAVEPLAEAKADWEFHCLFARAIQDRAGKRELRTFTDRSGNQRRLDDVYDSFTFGGRFTENDTEALLDELLRLTTNLGGADWKELKEKGFKRYTGLGLDLVNIGNATDIEPNQTITANTWHTAKKMPWPTLTRRIQFFIDHPFYLELGEELPVHKEPPKMGGEYPLAMTGGHTRWSIHAMWRDESNLLRLQRGEPVIVMGSADAKARRLADGDGARVWNDVGSFEVQVKVSPAMQPGQVVVYHGWEPYQFKGQVSHQALIPSPINPLLLAGGYYHLQPLVHQGQPGGVDRATSVEVARLGS